MTKQITITLSNHVFDLIKNTNNRSRQIEELILKGYDLDSGDWASLKEKYTKLIIDSRNKDDELKKLKAQVGKLKTLVKPTEKDRARERLLDVKNNKICAVCFQPLEDEITQKTPDGLIHDRCYLEAGKNKRDQWKYGKTTLEWGLFDDE